MTTETAICSADFKFDVRTDTDRGGRVATHCLYPSFETVHVYVVRVGDGFHVHDGGGAFESAWLHGREPILISRILNKECFKQQLEIVDKSIVCKATSDSWLTSAILAVANVSAVAAHIAVSRMTASNDHFLTDRIGEGLLSKFPKSAIAKDFVSSGRSGKSHHFDFAIRHHGEVKAVISAVNPHANSVASRYVSFSDSEMLQTQKLAVFDRPLETSDVSLLRQVASVVPIKSVLAKASDIYEH